MDAWPRHSAHSFSGPGCLRASFSRDDARATSRPIRVYLLASLVYFLLAAGAPTVKSESGEEHGLKVRATATEDAKPASAPERVGAAAAKSMETGEAMTPAERAAMREDIARAPAALRPLMRRAIEDPGGFKRGIFKTMPKMLFALLPVFAGIIALFYRGRKYPEHLYFAIHLHAFIFLALG